MYLIAVYGTLKRNHGNHGLLKRVGATYVGTGLTKEKMLLYARGIPFVYRKIPKSHITVEVFSVPTEEGMRMIDGLENHPDWYRRELTTIINIVNEDTQKKVSSVEAWMYFIDNYLDKSTSDLEITENQIEKNHKIIADGNF